MPCQHMIRCVQTMWRSCYLELWLLVVGPTASVVATTTACVATIVLHGVEILVVLFVVS